MYAHARARLPATPHPPPTCYGLFCAKHSSLFQPGWHPWPHTSQVLSFLGLFCPLNVLFLHHLPNISALTSLA